MEVIKLVGDSLTNHAQTIRTRAALTMQPGGCDNRLSDCRFKTQVITAARKC
jgi:hypothetical protein